MGVGPIPRSKVKEYLLDELSLKGARYDHAYAVLRKVDDEYQSIVNAPPKNKKPGEREPDTEVKADDVSGVRGMFGRLQDKQKRTKANKKT